MAELTVGVRLASNRHQAARQAYVDEVIETIPVLAYDRLVALEHADLLVAVRRSGRPRGAHDLLIAATARASGRTVLSEDQRAFDDLPGVTAIDR